MLLRILVSVSRYMPLHASTLPLYKYVDDGTIFEVVKNEINSSSRLQDEINDIQKWVNENDMKINEEKTKEMVISFNKPYPQFAPIMARS